MVVFTSCGLTDSNMSIIMLIDLPTTAKKKKKYASGTQSLTPSKREHETQEKD